MTYSVRNIAIALVLAVIAAVLVIIYTQNVQNQANKGGQTVKVLVATQMVAPGSEAKSILKDFTVKSVQRSDLVSGALSDPSQIPATATTVTEIPVGSQITSQMFGASSVNPINSQIAGTERAIQVAFNSNMVLSGTLQAGDTVDIVWEGDIKPASTSSKFTDITASRIIMRDIPVLSTSTSGSADTALATDSSTGGGNNGQNGEAVILGMPDTEVPYFVAAYNTGQIWFLLRPTHSALDGAPTIASACQMLSAGITQAQVKTVVPFC
jgi:Flp pilus assembly protein CpaB